MTLFKYLHPDRSDVLRSQSIRFSPIGVLNDPFEMKPHLSTIADHGYILDQTVRLIPQILEDELAKLPVGLRDAVPKEALVRLLTERAPQTANAIKNVTGAFMPMIRETFERKFGELLGILCLTESPNSLPMWAHYADSHRGFVIGFDQNSPFFNRRNSPSDDLRHLRKVEYSDTRPSLSLVEINSFLPFLTKGADWSYESEWRMVQPLDGASRVVGNAEEPVHLFAFPPHAVSSVILGCRMSEQKRAELQQIIAEIPAYCHVRCVQAELDERHYRVRTA